MHVRHLTSTSELAALRGPWRLLAGDVPFRSWEWLAAWWEQYGQARGVELYTLACFEGETLVAIAPWYRQRTPLGRVVRALGDGEVCSDYLGIPCVPGREREVAEAVATYLTSASAATGWDLLRLEALDADDATITALAASLGAGGHATAERPGPSCWRIVLPLDAAEAAAPAGPLAAAEVRRRWDAYLNTLSRSHRSQTRRCERRCQTLPAELHVVHSTGELSAAFDILVALHQRRRSQLSDPGLFASPRMQAFHRDAAERLLATGRLWLAWLEVDGRPVAAQYGAHSADTLYLYQSGVDPAALDLEPGRMMLVMTMHHALGRGIRCIDLLRGDESYKGHFRAVAHPSRDLLIAHRHLSGRLGYQALTHGRRLRSWARELRGFLQDRLRPGGG